MPDFFYEALTSAGVVKKEWITASDEAEIEERLRGEGSFLVRAEQKEKPAAKLKNTDAEIDRKDLIALMEYLSGAAQVGMPILATLEDVQKRMDNRKLRKIIGEVHESVSAGKSLSEALGEHPKAFPPFYVTTIQAGETSGQLDFVFRQLVEYMDWQEQNSSQMKQATIYPAIVLSAAGLLIIVLVTFVFPRIIPVLTSRSNVLPLPTRIVLATSNFLRHDWPYIIAFVLGSVGAFKLIRSTEKGRRNIDNAILKMPIFGPLILQLNMARVVTYLGLFYRTGVELILSLTMVEKMTSNSVVADAVRKAREDITGGQTMANAFGASPLFPQIVIRSIALGEVTGHLDEALQRATAYYSREVPAAVKRMITALQPVLIVLMGGIVLTVALAIMLPILAIYNTIGVRR